MSKCPRCSGKGEYMREIGGYRPCEYCNGTGELAEQKQTNFDQVTASPKALAKFLSRVEHKDVCEVIGCDNCPLEKKCSEGFVFKENEEWLTWLKQESEKQ